MFCVCTGFCSEAQAQASTFAVFVRWCSGDEETIMTIMDNARMRNVAARARGLILHPQAEWALIDLEPATMRGLYTSYVMILAAIPPVCGLIGGLIFGVGLASHGLHTSPIGLVVSAIIDYALFLGGVYVMALIIEATAPYFGGTKDRMQAMKVAAFFPTAACLAGVFRLIPALGALEILGLYSLFILWIGLPRLMRTPEDKALIYTLTVLVSSLVVMILISVVAGAASTSMQ